MSIMEEYLFMSETVTVKGENMLENKQIRLWDCCESLVNYRTNVSVSSRWQ